MLGLIMDRQLTITSIMEHADKNHPDVEIVSVTCDEPRHRYTYGMHSAGPAGWRMP